MARVSKEAAMPVAPCDWDLNKVQKNKLLSIPFLFVFFFKKCSVGDYVFLCWLGCWLVARWLQKEGADNKNFSI